MILLRFAIAVAAILLSTTAVIAAVGAILAAQWLLVAAVMLLGVGVVWGALKVFAWIGRASAGSTEQQRR